MTIVRDKTLSAIRQLSRKDLHWLKKQVKKELAARYLDDRAFEEEYAAGMAGMSNVMAGVAWALACRDSLRRSKGHTPTYGKQPASGEMWLPRELLIALRAEIKERRWSPLGALNANDVLNHLAAESKRRAPISDAEADELAADMVKVAHFQVRMASETATVHINTGD